MTETDVTKLEADLLAHWADCDDCGDEPEAACAIARSIREAIANAKHIKALQYYDDMMARAQERNPEWYRGSPRSPFFTSRPPDR
jgi:hypothetical protein